MAAKKPSPTVIVDKSDIQRDFTHYFAMFFWIGWMSFFFFFTLSAPLLYMYCTPLFTVLLGLIVASALSPITRSRQPQFCYAMGDWTMRKASEYFRMKVVAEDLEALEKSGTGIFAVEPHDVLPLSIFAFNDAIKGFKGHTCRGCMTSAAFKVPLMRHVYTWVNASDIAKKNVMKMLSEGVSPIICPGGVQEVTLMTNKSECILYLKSRFGFIKLALIHGVALIPVFTFGLRDSYSYWVPRHPLMLKLARHIGFLPMVFFGVWGVPLGPAKPVQYVNVIGKPIPVPKTPDPSEDDLKKYHALFIDRMTALFEDHKNDYGMGDVTLKYM